VIVEFQQGDVVPFFNRFTRRRAMRQPQPNQVFPSPFGIPTLKMGCGKYLPLRTATVREFLLPLTNFLTAHNAAGG